MNLVGSKLGIFLVLVAPHAAAGENLFFQIASNPEARITKCYDSKLSDKDKLSLDGPILIRNKDIQEVELDSTNWPGGSSDIRHAIIFRFKNQAISKKLEQHTEKYKGKWIAFVLNKKIESAVCIPPNRVDMSNGFSLELSRGMSQGEAEALLHETRRSL